jgi:hypothetical protein
VLGVLPLTPVDNVLELIATVKNSGNTPNTAG